MFWREEEESTIIEVKRGMERNESLTMGRVCKSWIGTSNSKTAMMCMHKKVLSKHCPKGLTGSINSSSPKSFIALNSNTSVRN